MDYLKVLQYIISIDNSVPPGSNYEKTIDYLVPVFSKMGFINQKNLIKT